MKLSKILSLIILLLLLNTEYIFSQNNDGYLTIYIYQLDGSPEGSTLLVIENDQIIEKEEFVGFHVKKPEKYLLYVSNLLDKYKKKGYNLIDVEYSGTHDAGVPLISYIFEKD